MLPELLTHQSLRHCIVHALLRCFLREHTIERKLSILVKNKKEAEKNNDIDVI
jgi:hypothetical protein